MTNELTSTSFEQSPIVELRQKAHFTHQYFENGAYPSLPHHQQLLEAPIEIATNINKEDDRQSRTYALLYERLNGKASPDLFKFQDDAKSVVDALFGQVANPDLIDTILALRGYHIIASKAGAAKKHPDRYSDLGVAVSLEMISRIPLADLLHRDLDIVVLYDSLQGAESTVAWTDFTRGTMQELKLRIDDRLHLTDEILQGQLRNIDHESSPNTYNRPLKKSEFNALNHNATGTIERLHLLKAYGVTSCVVPAAAIGLPWDILVGPPILDENAAYDEGAVADFYLLRPNEDRQHARMQFEADPETRMIYRTVGDGEGGIVSRLRLHDNGQLSHGHLYHNIPGNVTETIFDEVDARDAFVRIRGLLIALAFDSVVPDEVTRGQKIGGSVARELPPLLERSSDKGPITELLLPRRKTLVIAGISDKNRTPPKDWPAPRNNDVAGYMPRLREGTRRGPDAEEKARKYYEERNIVFTGIPEGHTFTKPYKRSGPERVTFRRAHFKNSSATMRHLGSLGAGA